MSQANPPVSVKINPEMKSRLEELSRRTKRSRNWLINEAVEEFVSRAEQREAYRREAAKSLEEYQQTGLHLTMEEADSWLSLLESGNDVEPPECHK
ncbi:Predicted transcriptional regulator [Kosakonia sacchari]|nr:Predicted transcriptional regulator [Kosakonia sacchari]